MSDTDSIGRIPYVSRHGVSEDIADHAFDDYGVSIFQSGPEAERSLVIFMHGLGGSPKSTWQRFPALVRASSVVRADVGVLNYVSGTRRLWNKKNPSPEQLSKMFSRIVEKFRYDTVFIVNHSMGGLIFRRALYEIHMSRLNASSVIDAIAGAIYLASPARGSALAYALAFRDLRFLRPKADSVRSLSQFDTDLILKDLEPASGRNRYWIPSFAGFGTRDRVVSPPSATLGFSSTQVHEFVKNHRSICKVSDPSHPVFVWVETTLAQIANVRSATKDEAPSAPVSDSVSLVNGVHLPSVERLFTVAFDQVNQRSRIQLRRQFGDADGISQFVIAVVPRGSWTGKKDFPNPVDDLIAEVKLSPERLLIIFEWYSGSVFGPLVDRDTLPENCLLSEVSTNGQLASELQNALEILSSRLNGAGIWKGVEEK